MDPCKICGREIRLASMKVSINRARGCAHWLETKDSPQCPCLKDWAWTKWRAAKAVPTITEQKIAEWNAQQKAARPDGGEAGE